MRADCLGEELKCIRALCVVKLGLQADVQWIMNRAADADRERHCGLTSPFIERGYRVSGVLVRLI
jgi:hypothetical protein